ncbi:MAG TPA: two-component system regulatory protein YycI, partial [Bacillales bacterium]|nr:two-component system regulatory protein YycI [Bacillales bacterium]
TINGQKVQTIRAKDETTIVSTLVKPVEVNLDTSEPFKDFLKNDVYKGPEYTIWKQGGENSPYILVQTFNDCPVFSKGQSEAASSGGQFPPGTLKINMKNGKIAGYEQSYLSLSTYQKKKDLIAPLNKAVFSLYKNDDILNNSTVKLIHLSYYNLIESDSDLGKVRLFVPTWHILVEENKTGKQKEFFVNAITSGILTPIKQEQTGG